MNKFGDGVELWIDCELLFDEVFDRFHIMVRCALNRFDALTICFRKISNNGIDIRNRLL